MARPTTTMEQMVDDPLMRAATSLGELAPMQELTVRQERNLFGDIVIAEPMKRWRDEARILKKIDIMAAAAGQRFFYRYPVRNRRKGTTDYIEGPSVKCTDAVMMLYMNATVESRTAPLGDGNYVCYSRFCDYENGVSMTLGQLVPKSATLGGEDEERRQQIAHNVGQSKSRRNVVVAALGEFVHRAHEAAKKSLIDRIGRDIGKSRTVIVDELAGLSVANIVARVEHVYGRKHSEWLAGDIARIYAELQGINDGMASIDETWPLPAPPEPRRSDGTDEPERTPPTATTPVEEDRETGLAGPTLGGESGPAVHTPPASAPPAAEAAEPTQAAEPAEHPEAGEPKNWRVPDGVIGQDNILRVLDQLMSLVQSTDDVDQIELQNASRIAKINGVKRATLNNALRALREQFIGS